MSSSNSVKAYKKTKIAKEENSKEEMMETSENSKKEEVQDNDSPKKLELDLSDEQQMWKFFKGKTTLMYRLCGSCQYKLYHAQDKWTMNKDGVEIKIHFCPKCVRINFMMTNMLSTMPSKKSLPPKNQKGEEENV